MNKIKLLFFVFITLFLNHTSFSQSSIDGIGIFKIDKTNIKVIDSLANNGYNLKTCNDLFSCSKYRITGMNIYEKVNDSINPELSLPMIKENRTFIIAEYNVAGIKITHLELNFYNDILFEIKTTGDLQLQIALKEKYNSTLKTDKKEISCRSIYGELKEEEVTYTTTYRDDDKIYAYSGLKIYFDDKCKEKTSNHTLITNIKTEQLVYSKNSEVSKKILEKRKLQNKLELNKL